MPLYYLILLAVIQGVTEFMPISSSGHLMLLSIMSGNNDQGNFLDVAAHIGSLIAVIIYFRNDVKSIIFGVQDLFYGKIQSKDAQLTLMLICATIPIVIVGFILTFSNIVDALRSIKTIAWATLIFAVVLYYCDQKYPSQIKNKWTISDACTLGLWQIIALIPGTSRSGIIISGARHLGYSRQNSTRIAMLMSIPTIAASGTLVTIRKISQIPSPQAFVNAAIIVLISCIIAIITLSIMMKLTKLISFTPYVIYRIIFGVFLLIYAY